MKKPVHGKIYFDSQCPLCTTVAEVIRKEDRQQALDLYPISQLSKELSPESYKNVGDRIVYINRDGAIFTGFNGIKRISVSIPVFLPAYPFLLFIGLLGAGDIAYDFVARRRMRFSRVLRKFIG